MVIGLCDPLGSPQAAAEMAARGATLFSLELLPRITRAQAMDVLSSQATVAGYRAVLLAAAALPKMFPMLMTAAGTIAPAKVFVVGGGRGRPAGHRHGLAAGRHRLGLRRAARRQGAGAEPGGQVRRDALGDRRPRRIKGGYAQEMDEEFYRKQRELMARVVAESDVVITTAAVPGKKAPVLITAAMVAGMAAGGGAGGPGRRAGRQLRVDRSRARPWSTTG